MFQNIGWVEIATILIIGLIVVGPERLPGLIADVRAAVYAARKAIANAKAELNGEFGELEELRRPLEEVARFRGMGPRGAVTRLLFDDDGEFMDSFDPKRIMAEAETEGEAARAARREAGESPRDGGTPSGTGPGQRHASPPPTAGTPPAAPTTGGSAPAPDGEGFSWDDIM